MNIIIYVRTIIAEITLLEAGTAKPPQNLRKTREMNEYNKNIYNCNDKQFVYSLKIIKITSSTTYCSLLRLSIERNIFKSRLGNCTLELV